jgi:hypothetical protein
MQPVAQGGGNLSPGFQPMARSQMQSNGNYSGLDNYGGNGGF